MTSFVRFLLNEQRSHNIYVDKRNCLFQLRYGEVGLRGAVPLALGLISVSNPKLQILDTLSKFSHDNDAEVAHNSIFAMGLVGAGMSEVLFS